MSVLRRALSIACALVAIAGSVSAQAPASPASPPAVAPSGAPVGGFAHLHHRDGGPGWTIDSIEQALPPGTAPMEFDPKQPIPAVRDAAAALKSAMRFLKAREPASHEVAYRVAGATANQTKSPEAFKLLTLLNYHGIGTRVDAGSAVRTALTLVRLGDVEASRFVAGVDAKSFLSNVKTMPSFKKIVALSQPTAIRTSGAIEMLEGTRVTLTGDADLAVTLDMPMDQVKLEDFKVGRVLSVGGVFAGDQFLAFTAEVPEPVLDFEWKLDKKPMVGGRWQLHSVRVTFRNKGIQPVKQAKFSVRCYVNQGRMNDHTEQATCKEIAPGKSETVTVSFEMYSYQYYDAVSAPKAEVTIDEVEW